MSEIISEDRPAITWLNMSGDITITWNESNEDAVLAMVEKKMKEGFSFFIIKPRALGLLGNKKVKAKSISDVKKAGQAILADEDFDGLLARLHDSDVEKVVSNGSAKLAKPSTGEKEMVTRARSAKEVVRAQSVAVKPVVGG